MNAGHYVFGWVCMLIYSEWISVYVNICHFSIDRSVFVGRVSIDKGRVCALFMLVWILCAVKFSMYIVGCDIKMRIEKQKSKLSIAILQRAHVEEI